MTSVHLLGTHLQTEKRRIALTGERDDNWPSKEDTNKEDTQQLELVEQTMKQVAERDDADLDLLARLDSLRKQVRAALRRGSRRGHA
jgi:hypothetical protein